MLRCLIVEDDELSRELLALQMEPYALCDQAENGLIGVERFTDALQAGYPYDLILLDIMMPEMDGLEAAKAIRAFEEKQGITIEKGVAIVVLSSLSTPQDVIQAYVAAQSAAHLVKPVQPEKLVKTLRKLDLIPAENA
ncbi:MAG: response regulator [Geobacter sp.]|nr:response regulator [Geobacter sp.]